MKTRSSFRCGVALAALLTLLVLAGGCKSKTESPMQDRPGATPQAGATTGPASPQSPAVPPSGEAAPPEAGATPILSGEIAVGECDRPGLSYLARDYGWYEKNTGARVRWVRFESEDDLLAALEGGTIDLGAVSVFKAAQAIARGAPCSVIWVRDLAGDTEGLVARKGSGIRRVGDLRKRKVGATFATAGHYQLLAALEQAGMSAGELTVRNLPPEAMARALERREIEAAWVADPTLSALKAQGAQVIVSPRTLAPSDAVSGTVLLANRRWLEARPELAAGWLKAEMKAVDSCSANPNEAALAVERHLGIVADEALAQLRRMVFLSGAEQMGDDWMGQPGEEGALAMTLKAVADYLLEQGVVKDTASADSFREAIEPTCLLRALQEEARQGLQGLAAVPAEATPGR